MTYSLYKNSQFVSDSCGCQGDIKIYLNRENLYYPRSEGKYKENLTQTIPSSECLPSNSLLSPAVADNSNNNNNNNK